MSFSLLLHIQYWLTHAHSLGLLIVPWVMFCECACCSQNYLRVVFRERDDISFEWCRHCRLPAPPTSMGLKVACPLRRPHALLTHTQTHVPGVGRTHGRHPPPQKQRRDGNRRRTTVGSFETSWRATGEICTQDQLLRWSNLYPRSAASPLHLFRSWVTAIGLSTEEKVLVCGWR